MRLLQLCLLCMFATVCLAQSNQEHLPPVAAFAGKSRELMLSREAEWATPFEASGGLDSPELADAYAWIERLVRASRSLRLVTIGESDEGRPLQLIVASREGAKDAKTLRKNRRPTVFAHAGIHAGEIDGLDAGMMLLRDLTALGRSDLLERCNFIFIPVLNLDGHARRSTTARINQRGPLHQGWRTNRRNLNGNRDFMKLDTPEIRAVVRVLDEWQPDLYLDLHVTDGADYQYDITYGFNGPHAYAPAISTWLQDQLRPRIDAELREFGHVPGELVFAVDGETMEQGNFGWTSPPRFSNGYGDARQLPTILVENHSLKPYDQRVLGTYVLLRACMETVAAEAAVLREAIAADRARRLDPLPIAFDTQEGSPGTIEFLGIESRKEASPISGNEIVRWTGRKLTQSIPHLAATRVTRTIARPQRYYIPAAWSSIADRLSLHGIRVERVETRQVVECEMLRLPAAKIDDANENPYEGRVRIAVGAVEPERRQLVLEPGSFIVPTDQPLGSLAMLLLEPESVDSLFQWGFLLGCLQRTEYFENYAIEPLAAQMLVNDPQLQRDFEQKLLQDKEFAESPRARLEYFYQRSPYFDAEYRLYPIGRGL